MSQRTMRSRLVRLNLAMSVIFWKSVTPCVYTHFHN
jgi:hypothetical protein